MLALEVLVRAAPFFIVGLTLMVLASKSPIYCEGCGKDLGTEVDPWLRDICIQCHDKEQCGVRW